MKIIWLREASIALDFHYEYLATRNPKNAKLAFARIVGTMKRLDQYPHSGRPGQLESTRELIVPGLPYLIVYRLGSNAIEILRVSHTSRVWPELMQCV